jgi:ABC-type dipeptide/oligopeptide/nickel transport system permease component
MTRRLLERLLVSLIVVFGAVTLVFLILNWLPGDPAALIAGENASEESIARVRAQLGTELPLAQRYGDYLHGLVHGDLGRSFVTREPVAQRLLAQLPATAMLTAAASLVAIVAGIGLGVLSARYQGRWPDKLIQSLGLFVASMPPFWFGILLILGFSVQLGWLPVLGDGSGLALVLPVTVLGLAVSVYLMRMVRDCMLETLHDPYVLTLRAKGLTERRVFYVHVLRNALIPTVTLLGVIAGELLSGAVVIETLFARQGIGRLAVEALGQKDIPVVQGAILFAAVSYVIVNLLVDVSYALIDPRVHA